MDEKKLWHQPLCLSLDARATAADAKPGGNNDDNCADDCTVNPDFGKGKVDPNKNSSDFS